jgi:hypothetical protein
MRDIGTIGRMAYGREAGDGPSDQLLHWLTGWYAVTLRPIGEIAFAWRACRQRWVLH